MTMAYTYWQNDGWYIGFMDEYPDWWTQGHSKAELETMLRSSYTDFSDIMDTENEDKDLVSASVLHDSFEIPVKTKTNLIPA